MYFALSLILRLITVDFSYFQHHPMKTFKLRRKVFVLKEHELYRQKDEIFNSFHRSTKWEMNETLIVLCSFMRLRLYRKKRIQIEIVSVN